MNEHLTRREALWQAAAVERDPSSLLAGAEPSLEKSMVEDDAPHDTVKKARKAALPKMTLRVSAASWYNGPFFGHPIRMGLEIVGAGVECDGRRRAIRVR